MTKATDRRKLLQEAIREIQRLKRANQDLAQRGQAALAIVGGACRFPGGVNDLASFHQQQQAGISAVSRLCDHPRFRAHRDDPILAGMHAALLDDVEGFDGDFFNIPAREAALMDPHQRLLLEVAHHALEDAGIARARLAGTETGVFVGTSSLDHALRVGAHQDREAVNAYTGTGAALSINAGRLSHGLGVTGPSLVVDTACSSSLVAIHLACQSLRRGECRTAIAAGINLILATASSQTLAAAGVLSPSGACHTFAAAADGYVRGEGCAALVLKTLDDAQADGDAILAVIHGSATNHDGASSGLTVPTGPAQARVIQRALADAGLSADDIDYLEAHGTGTQLGDPIEVNVLGKLFGAVNPIAIGSAKTMIGHLEAAAGIAGVLRTALALHHGRLPAHLHFEKPNQHINWDKLPLTVNTESRPWPQRNRPAYAGVSSFGIGGSNAHVVLGAPPTQIQATPAKAAVTLLTLSAHNQAALKDLARAYRDHEAPSTLAVGVRHRRDHYPTRLALVGTDDTELRTQLDRYIINGSQPQQSAPPRRLAMMIGGQGTQYAGMGAALDVAEPVFRAALDECAEVLADECDIPLRDILNDGHRLTQTQYAQPAIFSVAYASAQLWQHWGLKPELVFGHSVGEYVAACLAGIFTLETALKLVAARGRVMATATGGAMAAIHRDEKQTRALLEASNLPLDIAAMNSPKQTVVAGGREHIENLISQLKQRGIGGKLLPVDYAFHARHMDAAAAAFADIVAAAEIKPARLPIIANVSGRLDDGAMSNAGYWVDHIRQPVQFAASLQQAAELGINSFLEVGACSVLTGPARQNLSDPTLLWLAGQKQKSDGRPASALRPHLTSLAQWYEAGGKVAWHQFDAAHQSAPVKAPHYPFQHDHYPLIGSAAGPATTASIEPPAPAATIDSDQVQDEIITLLADVLMVPKASINADASLLELGSDSVALADAAQKLERRFGVQLQLRQFFEDLQSPRLLAAHIAAHTPLRRQTGPESSPTGTGDDDVVAALFQQQLDIMQRQLAVLEQRKIAPPSALPRAAEATAAQTAPRAKTTLPWGGLNLVSAQLSPRQQAHLDALTAAYTARTQASKSYAGKSRQHLTDNRASAGFRFSTKEMLYPIVAERSEGAYFWDLDGNRYIDITMGFGTYLLGHQPTIVNEALQETLAKGMQIGPQSALAGDTAALICQLTGADRAAFLNSGTEAVMTACRLARATTGRRKIAMFAGAYHGHGDATLGSADENGNTYAAIAGIPDSAVADMVVLHYGEDSALRYVEEHGHHLAAVLVEPVQSRNPGLQPRAFLQRLRELTHAAGCALIFDEMITGFRSAPGGAQAWFDVRADLCTYGKVVGGGMPIGVVAGTARFMDALDGGAWSFGDDSYPTAETTFFAGTFCKHPLTMAAAHAVLSHIAACGPSLQQELNARTTAFADELNAWFQAQAVPIRIDHFASLFRFNFQQNLDLFFYHLVHQGVYIWEGRTCFFSTAHGDADIAAVKTAIKTAVNELRGGGFLGETEAGAGQDRFPLSTAQQQMMLARARDTGADSAYHLTADLELNGVLDITRLAEAYLAIQRRHPALRLRNDGEQQWHDAALDQLQHIDLRGHTHPAAALRTGLTEAANESFDLQQHAPCRARLFQTAPQRFHLHLRLHHVVADGWSAGLVLRDLWQSYAGRGTTETAPSFAEYLERHSNDDYGHQTTYWLARFRGRQFGNPFPARASAGHARAGARHALRIPAAAVKKTAAAHGVTPFMLLLTAWCRRLQQHAENRDWIIATPSTGRSRVEDQGVVGYCTHLLPLLAQPGGDSFAQHLDAMRRQVLDAFENADVPFADWFAQLSREQGATPAPAALFNYEKAPALPAVTDLTLTLVPSKITTSAFPIIFNAVDLGEHYELACDFQLRHFDEQQVDNLLKALTDDLRALVETGTVAVDAVKPQSAPLAPGDPRWLSRRLADVAAASPQAAALCDGKQTLDYATLYRQVQRLAADLRKRGIGPEKQVALVAAPSINRIAALLAVWHCGAVAVVIDADQPAGRRNAMLQRCAISLCLGDTETDGERALDSWVEACNAAPAHPVEPTPVHADNAAYLVHTSGSSGAPKPVCVTYGGYRHVCDDLSRRYQIGAGDRLLQLVGLHFDVAMADIALALGNGACLVLAPHNCLRDGEGTVALLARERISHVQLPPSALAHWPEHPLPDLRHLILGGEVCPPAGLARWAGNRTIHNAYGPSETTITVCAGLLQAGQPVNLGHALPGCTLRVVDDHGREQPAGVEGELVIGGPTLARGYAGDARLSATMFVPDPNPTTPGARLYRSGDRVCRNSDGTLRFLGRIDRQIKWRGLRIELGEIEQALHACSNVSQAAVVFRDNRLDGYVTGTDLDRDLLRRQLAERLPATHLPQSLTVLASFPVTANGKLDQQALPQPNHKPLRPLQKQSEQQIAEIWRELLPGVEIGADSHFFELGGHSLLAGQVRTRLRERFGITLDLPQLFEYPILADLARVAESRQGHTTARITPAPDDAAVALTSQQQRLWFLEQFDGPSATHNMPLALHLHGDLDQQALSDAVDALNRRHPMLTSYVLEQNDQALIGSGQATTLRYVDLQTDNEETRNRELARRLVTESQTPFVLKQGPLVRWTLFHLAPQHHVLALTLHHLIADGWSMGVLLGDLTAGYNAARAGQTLPAPAKGLQYRDFAYHQQQHRDQNQVSADFWRQTLADLPPLLELPTDRPRPRQQDYCGALLPIHFAPAVANQVDSLAQQQGVTPFMVLLAGFKLLLADWSGSNDIAVGTPVAGRDHGDLEQVVGLFLNTLVLRNHIDHQASFADLLAQVKNNSLAAFNHADLPFERVVDLLQPQRSLAHAPLFQVMFILNNAPLPPLHLDGLTSTLIEQPGTRSEFDLTLSLRQSEEGLVGDLEYRTDLFDRATMERLRDSLEQVLLMVCRQPQRRLSALCLLPAATVAQLRVQSAAPPLPVEALQFPIHRRFEAWAQHAGDNLAVVDGDERLSYDALNRAANQLAHHLRGLGLPPESQIGICLPRGAGTVIAVLACLKAGLVYVPLDPRLPSGRLASMVAHGDIKRLITNAATDNRADWYSGAKDNLDALADHLAHLPDDNPTLQVEPDQAAYAVFTSGTTGAPKAVVNTHAALASTAAAWLEAYDLQPHQTHLQMAAFSFDVWGGDLMRALCSGARLVICPADTLLDPPGLFALMEREQVSHAEFVPAVLRHLVQWLHDSKRRLDFMTMIVTGSDLWYTRDQVALEAVCSESTRLINSYGLTEASIDSTWYQAPRGPAGNDGPAGDESAAGNGGVLAIGQAFAGVETWVLNRFGHLSAPGVVGELCIGGPGIARGYHGLPAKTADAFVPHPFPTQPGARLYRTGDLARRHHDGTIELVGRRDHQVKIRGFRIETAEIEAHLTAHDAVHVAVVQARGDASHRYLVCHYTGTADSDTLRAYLAARLPDYMVPALWQHREGMPLTANGKIDRLRLAQSDIAAPTANQSARDTDHNVGGPAATLLAVWRELLPHKEIGVDDNFFACGGDSILSLQVVAKARHAGLTVTAKQIFEHQTIAELAQVVTTTTAAPTAQVQKPVHGAVALTPIQIWFFQQNFAQAHHFNQALLFEQRTPLDPQQVRTTLAHLAAHHDQLRARFSHDALGAVVQWLPEQETGNLLETMSLGDLHEYDEAERRQRIATHCAALQNTLDLEQGPAWRVFLLDCGQAPSLLLWVCHHLIVDGVSWRILLEDFATVYAALAAGQTPALPPKSTAFQSWAQQQHAAVRMPALRDTCTYWQNALSAAPTLPIDTPKGSNRHADLALVQVGFDRDTTHQLLHEIPQAKGITLQILLLAALTQALARWSKADGALLEVEHHGRDGDTDVARTVGWFTATYPLWLPNSDDFDQLLKQTKQRLQAVPNGGVGFGLLRTLHPDPAVRRAMAALPTPRIGFNYLGQLDGAGGADLPLQPVENLLLGDIHADNARTLELEITAHIQQGRLTVTLDYSRERFAENTINALGDGLQRSLSGLITHCLAGDAPLLTPSDFPNADLAQDDLDRLLTFLG